MHQFYNVGVVGCWSSFEKSSCRDMLCCYQRFYIIDWSLNWRRESNWNSSSDFPQNASSLFTFAFNPNDKGLVTSHTVGVFSTEVYFQALEIAKKSATKVFFKWRLTNRPRCLKCSNQLLPINMLKNCKLLRIYYNNAKKLVNWCHLWFVLR